MAWHRRFGFAEKPDLRRANLYLQQAKVELWRREKISRLTPEERAKLAAEVARWEAEVEELERIAWIGKLSPSKETGVLNRLQINRASR
jgi:hypothetical protein